MKGMDILCASQAATAICPSMEQPSSSVLAGSSSPAIDRYNPIIRDSRRCAANPLPPAIPKPHRSRHKKKNPKENDHRDQMKISTTPRKSWSCTKPGEFISPPGSTRYLLSGKELLTALSDLEPPQPPPLNLTSTSKLDEHNDQSREAKPPSSSPSSPSPDQVVVLRVSLHCRGCERKMRKHISRMEGVRSFNIDFAAKKVTVAGKITPLEVLSSISKVKNAQLWAPTISSEFKGAWLTENGSFVGVA